MQGHLSYKYQVKIRNYHRLFSLFLIQDNLGELILCEMDT